jgi:hypothetical protein
MGFVTLSGSLYTQGNGENGRLGLGNTFNQNAPRLVGQYYDDQTILRYGFANVEEISCGGAHTAVITRKRAEIPSFFLRREETPKFEIPFGSMRCLGQTKRGERCRNLTSNREGYCYLHLNQVKKQQSK